MRLKTLVLLSATLATLGGTSLPTSLPGGYSPASPALAAEEKASSTKDAGCEPAAKDDSEAKDAKSGQEAAKPAVPSVPVIPPDEGC